MVKLSKKFVVAFHIIFFATQNPVFSQCSSAPSLPPCSGGNGVATDGININSGDTYYYASSGTFNNIYMNGGNLVVCGTLTINTLYFNQETIYVDSGASLTIVNNVYPGGSLVNYGTVTFNGTVVWQGNPSMIWNATSTSILNANTMHLNNNSQFINNGTATISNFVIQTNTTPAVCQGINAILNLNQFSNNTTNSIISPSGMSCLSVSSSATLSNSVTTYSDLIACVLSGANVIFPTNWGSATVYNPCNSCSAALPIELISFDGSFNENKVYLKWATAAETNNDYFTIERSADGVSFEILGIVDGAGNSYQTKYYTFIDAKPLKGISYYRLKQTDFNGQYKYSNIIPVNCINNNIGKINVYPNPITNVLMIEIGDNNEPVNFEILNAYGQVVFKGNLVEKTTLRTCNFAPGVYQIKFISDKTFELKKIIKE
jgi:hypothetical protein